MVSIIVPVYNEEENIKQIQWVLRRLKGDFEVIFCDGGSTDRTRELIRTKYKVVQCPKGRARQMNCASLYAKGDILLFLHCDSRLKSDAILKIQKMVDRGYEAGCMRCTFDSNNPMMKMYAQYVNARARHSKLAISDQGIFVTQEVFMELGGLPVQPIFDDYEFCLRMKKEKVRFGQADSTVLVSAKEYEECGVMDTVALLKRLQAQYRVGTNVDDLAVEYEVFRKNSVKHFLG